ncbi:MAG: hypothetical protein U0572_11240 [Phycisphaerales bacterium]
MRIALKLLAVLTLGVLSALAIAVASLRLADPAKGTASAFLASSGSPTTVCVGDSIHHAGLWTCDLVATDNQVADAESWFRAQPTAEPMPAWVSDEAKALGESARHAGQPSSLWLIGAGWPLPFLVCSPPPWPDLSGAPADFDFRGLAQPGEFGGGPADGSVLFPEPGAAARASLKPDWLGLAARGSFRVIYTNLLIAAILHAPAWALAALLLRRITRRIAQRIFGKPGHCRHCGYPLAVSTRCSECGHAGRHLVSA